MKARHKLFQSSYRYLLGASSIYGLHLLHSRLPNPYSQYEAVHHNDEEVQSSAPLMDTLLGQSIAKNTVSQEESITVRYPSQYSIVLTDKVLADLHLVIPRKTISLEKMRLIYPSFFPRPMHSDDVILKRKDITDFIHFCRENCSWENEHEITVKDYENFLLFFEKWENQSLDVRLDERLFSEMSSMSKVMSELLYQLHPSDFASHQLTHEELSRFFGKGVIDEKKIKYIPRFRNTTYDLQLSYNEKICAKLDEHHIGYQVIDQGNDAAYISVRWTQHKELADVVKSAVHCSLPPMLFAIPRGVMPVGPFREREALFLDRPR